MTIRRIVHGWAKHDTEHITQIGLVRDSLLSALQQG